MSKLRAIIFDFNGVIIDDEPLHYRAMAATMREHGLQLSEDEYYRTYLGINDHCCFKHALSLDPECPLGSNKLRAAIDRKAQHYRSELAGHVVLFPGVGTLLRELSERVPLAIASGAHASEIDFVLARGGIAPYFSAIVSSDDVVNGKPNPEIFLTALRKLKTRVPCVADLSPEECAVVEDAPNGVLAARAAGMRTLAVVTTAAADRLGQAQHVVPKLEGLSFSRIAEALGFDA
jgi:beta-phosphoglucomutase